MPNSEDENSPNTLQEQERDEEARDLAGLRPNILQNIGRLSNSATAVRTRYVCLLALHQKVLQEQYLAPQHRLERSDPNNPHHRTQIRRLQADMQPYPRPARA